MREDVVEHHQPLDGPRQRHRLAESASGSPMARVQRLVVHVVDARLPWPASGTRWRSAGRRARRRSRASSARGRCRHTRSTAAPRQTPACSITVTRKPAWRCGEAEGGDGLDALVVAS